MSYSSTYSISITAIVTAAGTGVAGTFDILSKTKAKFIFIGTGYGAPKWNGVHIITIGY